MRDLVKIDHLTAEDMGAEYQVESMGRTEKEIRYLIEKLHGISRLSLALIYETGRRLAAVKKALDHGQFTPWLEQNFELTDRTAQKYMKLYHHFACKPAALLEGLSVQKAYALAGVIKAVDADADEEEPEVGPLQFAGKRDAAAERANMVGIFTLPTLSGRALENHRVQNVSGTVYVYRKDVGTVAPAMALYLGKPLGLPEPDWLEMQESYVIATELYLEKIEAYERCGRLNPPEDCRLLSVVERGEAEKRGRKRRATA